ncbi:SDR family oxidoreductase [Streptomyces sp. enrichment culture]|uniref:SDR family oxidoreductase n=2 Tax=Streptomyces sp. enrichment culture TaxID=1795815 RepID=UPI003F560B5F
MTMILVTGATGNVGGKVLSLLRAGGHKVRALSRDPERAGLAADAGLEVVAADLGRPETLAPALDGVQKVFLMSLGANKATHDAHLVAAAREAGVEHVVQLSTLGVEVAEDPKTNPLGHWHRIAEDALRDSGVAWTILRPNGFMSMNLGWAASIKTEGVARGPLADVPEAIVDPRDIAEVAVRALTEPGHEGRVYELTGPQALTGREQLAVIGALLGRDLRFETVPLAAHREMMLRHFSEETVNGVITTLREAIEHGSELHGRLSPDVRDVLGRKPRSFADWVHDHLDFYRA